MSEPPLTPVSAQMLASFFGTSTSSGTSRELVPETPSPRPSAPVLGMPAAGLFQPIEAGLFQPIELFPGTPGEDDDEVVPASQDDAPLIPDSPSPSPFESEEVYYSEGVSATPSPAPKRARRTLDL